MVDIAPQTEKVVGQPSKAELIRRIYAAGGSDVEVASALELTINSFRELCNELPELGRLAELGRTIAEAWWVGKGRSNLMNKEFNSSLYNFQMKNRYGWADKVDTGDKGGSDPMNVDQMMVDLQKQLKKLGKTHPEILNATLLNDKDTQ